MKAAAKPVIVFPPTAERSQLIDEFGELDRKVKEFAPTAKRHKDLGELIRSWYDQHPANLPAVATGATYDIQVSERGEERGFSLAARMKIFTRLGKQKACQAFTVTLKAVTAQLGELACNELATKERTGSRKLVAVLKAPAQPVAKAA